METTNTPPMKPQHLTRLEIQNVMCLKALTIYPDGNTVIIASEENGQGKSSVLQSIAMLFGGAREIPEVPIRRGASKSKIVGETEDLVITLDMSASGPKLKLTTKEGIPIKSPQQILDSMRGQLFDPMEFDRMADKQADKALDVLRKLVGLDFTVINKNFKAAYDQRTGVNRDLDKTKSTLQAYIHFQEAPKEEVTSKSMADELEKAQETNKQNAVERAKVEPFKTAYRRVLASIEQIDRDIEEGQKEIERLQAALIRAQNATIENNVRKAGLITELDQAAQSIADAEQLASLITDVDTAPILARMTQADEINTKVRSNRRRRELETEVTKLSVASQELTDEMDRLEKEKTDALSKAKFPVDNISFNDSSVLLDGVPWSQGSTAQRIRASVAMGMALNPVLRVMLIRHGNDLSPKSLAMITAMAVEKDFHVWIETLNTSIPGAVIIEDGSIKE